MGLKGKMPKMKTVCMCGAKFTQRSPGEAACKKCIEKILERKELEKVLKGFKLPGWAD